MEVVQNMSVNTFIVVYVSEVFGKSWYLLNAMQTSLVSLKLPVSFAVVCNEWMLSLLIQDYVRY